MNQFFVLVTLAYDFLPFHTKIDMVDFPSQIDGSQIDQLNLFLKMHTHRDTHTNTHTHTHTHTHYSDSIINHHAQLSWGFKK